MKSTLEPSPGWRSALPWLRRQGDSGTAEGVMQAYYAGWFLDHATAGPRTIKEGREEQQFPQETVQAAISWFAAVEHDLDAATREWGYYPYINTLVDIVFAYEHFRRFEAAPRIWPPLKPAAYRCNYRASGYRGGLVGVEHAIVCDNSVVLSYRRDYDAPGWYIRRGREQLTQTCGGTYHECPHGLTQPHNHYTPTV